MVLVVGRGPAAHGQKNALFDNYKMEMNQCQRASAAVENLAAEVPDLACLGVAPQISR